MNKKNALPPRASAAGLLLSPLAALLLSLGGCAAPPVGVCQPGGSAMTVVCGFKNPEDIRRLPDQRTLLISQVSGLLQRRPGQLLFFDTLTQGVSAAYPAVARPVVDAAAEGQSQEVWGASNCPGAPGSEFSPLGISVQRRHDGRWQVAAVNHGGRMSVEMFELSAQGSRYQLEWRGCVIPPAKVSMNSVALLRSGGFVASHMFDPGAPALLGLNTSLLKSQLGIATGHAFEWLPTREQEFRVLADSHGPFPNGVALSADETAVFVSLTAANELRKLDRASGKRLGSVSLESPDNLSWDDRGFLLAASLLGNRLQHFICIRHPDEGCGLAFRIARVDPADMRAETVLEHEGAPMGAVTVAQQLGDSLYLGSFTGDRILRVPYRRRMP